MRRFYKYALCIIENFRLTNPHLHHGLLGNGALRPLLQCAISFMSQALAIFQSRMTL